MAGRFCVLMALLASLQASAAVRGVDPSDALAVGAATAANGSGAVGEELVARLIVQPHSIHGVALHRALLGRDASALSSLANVPLSVHRQMSGGAHVIQLDHAVPLSGARAIAARLMGSSAVEAVEPDLRKRHMALTPSDPDYASLQWNLFSPSSTDVGSANLPGAWAITEGNNAVTVAVIDTGYRPHQDLGFSYSGASSRSATVLSSGYTFITDIPSANNGTGRGPDAQDPGDWITSAENRARGGQFNGCGVSNSSWHGTHVAGIIAAQMNNGIGIAGVAPNIQILPVRVLGKCGGSDSDIIDGMRWAAGLTVPNVPVNPHPAKVLNMSLGGSGGAACSAIYQSAVTEILNAGKVIVVAAGNDGTSLPSAPANCAGVIAVTANSLDGDNAWYATVGPQVTISAPGGGCGGMNYPSCNSANSLNVYSLVNSGSTSPLASPGADSYVAYAGTSMATPHVAAVAALMFSVNPALTPAQITAHLQATARPFPANTICTQVVNKGACGAGLLDAYQAVASVNPSLLSPPVITLGVMPAVVAPGDVLTLTGSALAASGESIVSYAWTQESGQTLLAISNGNSATASVTASAAGSYAFKLTVTDSAGQTATATYLVVVSALPRAQSISVTAAAPASAAYNSQFTVAATAPGGTVSYSSGSPAVCTNVGAVFTMVASSGTCVVQYSQPGSGTYTAAALSSNTLASKAGQTLGSLLLSPAALVVGASATVSATSSSGLGASFSSTSSGVCAVSGSTVTVVGPGTCTITATQAGDAHYSAAAPVTQSFTAGPATYVLDLLPGWNLIGNGVDAPIDVAHSFADSNSFVTVWKWSAALGNWSFYSPLLAQQGSALSDYVASNGYQLLSSIAGGEGYWVNAQQAVSVTLNLGNPVTVSTMATQLHTGWNLVATAAVVTPATVNLSLGSAPPGQGGVPVNLNSLWAWDNASSLWYFYAPSLDGAGTLANYIATKHYLDFAGQGKLLGNGTGFWVNMP